MHVIKIRTLTPHHIEAISAKSNYNTFDVVIGKWK